MFLEIFNELLAEHDLNRKKFSEQSGIPYPTVTGWTNLNRLPDYTALLKIADFFHCSVDYLMGRQDDFGNAVYLSLELLSSERALVLTYRKLKPENQELIFKLTKNLANA